MRASDSPFHCAWRCGPSAQPVQLRKKAGPNRALTLQAPAPPCRHVSILVPQGDPLHDPFAGRRPERLPNGSFPLQVG